MSFITLFYSPFCRLGTSCPHHQEFAVCGKDWKCEKSCAGRNAECPTDSFCEGGCQCREGYYRDTNNACVKATSCVAAAANPRCATNEIWRSCSHSCTDECVMPEDCFDNTCAPGCFCENGFVRIDGRCVPTSRCLRI